MSLVRDKPSPNCVSRRLAAVGQVQLLHNISQVGLYRVLGDEQGIGDFLIARPLSHQLQHLSLSWAQVSLGSLNGFSLHPGAEVFELGEQLGCHKGGDYHSALGNMKDGMNQLIWLGVLKDVTPGTKFHGSEEVSLLVRDGQDEDINLGHLCLEGLNGF